MSMIYDRTYKVPTWVVVAECEQTDAIIKWFKDAEAHIREWPGNSFEETLYEFKNRGWLQTFRDINPLDGTIVISSQLLAMALKRHAEKCMNPSAEFMTNRAHFIDRKVASPQSIERLFDDAMRAQDSMTLSHAFQIGEICHDTDRKRYPLWVTKEPASVAVISMLADRVITIGPGVGYDFDTTGITNKKIPAFLVEKFS